MTVKIRGIAEINQSLKSLPNKMQQNVLQSGNSAVGRALAKQSAALTKHPTLKANLSVRQNPDRKATKGILLGLRKPYSSLAHLFEFGTAERVQTKTGRRTGRMKPEPFMRPALELLGETKIEEIWSKAASRNLDRQLKKLAKP